MFTISIILITLTPLPVFFPVKIKSARESHFWPFFNFFHGWQSRFHAHFFHFFHVHFFDFTGTFLKFSPVSRALFFYFQFSRTLFVFHGHYFLFHGHFFFSRKEKKHGKKTLRDLVYNVAVMLLQRQRLLRWKRIRN